VLAEVRNTTALEGCWAVGSDGDLDVVLRDADEADAEGVDVPR
jgi:hypothetical protein